jgi:replication fork protection complex subunit Csm3/Swi3
MIYCSPALKPSNEFHDRRHRNTSLQLLAIPMANENSPQAAASRPVDFVDDLFDYDVGLDGILQEISTNTSTANASKQTAPPDNSGVVLGLDEEVKVAKKRQPVPKLDENRSVVIHQTSSHLPTLTLL